VNDRKRNRPRERKERPELPLQPLAPDGDGVVRFVQNPLVRHMYDEGRRAGVFDLNRLASLPAVSRAEFAQLLQLLGYSLSGYEENSMVSAVEWERAAEAARKAGLA
jgi:hypothetical protein